MKITADLSFEQAKEIFENERLVNGHIRQGAFAYSLAKHQSYISFRIAEDGTIFDAKIQLFYQEAENQLGTVSFSDDLAKELLERCFRRLEINPASLLTKPKMTWQQAAEFISMVMKGDNDAYDWHCQKDFYWGFGWECWENVSERAEKEPTQTYAYVSYEVENEHRPICSKLMILMYETDKTAYTVFEATPEQDCPEAHLIFAQCFMTAQDWDEQKKIHYQGFQSEKEAEWVWWKANNLDQYVDQDCYYSDTDYYENY